MCHLVDILYWTVCYTVPPCGALCIGLCVTLCHLVCGYGDEIEVGNSYKSLELHFTTILSLIQAVGKDQNQSDTQISMETRKCTEKWISFNV